MIRCCYPDCVVTLGLTKTDLGPLCGLHLGIAQDIVRNESRFAALESRIAELEKACSVLLGQINRVGEDDLKIYRQLGDAFTEFCVVYNRKLPQGVIHADGNR